MAITLIDPPDFRNASTVQVDSDADDPWLAVDEIESWAEKNEFVRTAEYHPRQVLIDGRRVNAYVPPSFFREFLNVATRPLFERGRRIDELREEIRAHWDDLLSLPLIVVPLREIDHHSGALVFDDLCPAADAWYVAAA